MKALRCKDPEIYPGFTSWQRKRLPKVGFAGERRITTTAQKCSRALRCPDPPACPELPPSLRWGHIYWQTTSSMASKQLVAGGHGRRLQESRADLAVSWGVALIWRQKIPPEIQPLSGAWAREPVCCAAVKQSSLQAAPCSLAERSSLQNNSTGSLLTKSLNDGAGFLMVPCTAVSP